MNRLIHFSFCILFISISTLMTAQTNRAIWKGGNSVWNESSNGSAIQAGVYGTKGLGQVTNFPGARNEAVSWVDSNGNQWLFGGDGFDKNGMNGYLNDLWRFEPSNGKWTWMGGGVIIKQPGVYGTKGLGAVTNVPGARYQSVSWTDLNGNLWLFGGIGIDKNGVIGLFNDLWRFEPANGQWSWMGGSDVVDQPGIYGIKGIGSSSNIPGARRSAASWTDDGGMFWLFGGSGFDKNGNGAGLTDLWKYDVQSGNWAWMGGKDAGTASSVFGTKGVSSPTNMPGYRDNAATWVDHNGNLWLFGGGSIYSNDLWRYQISIGEWTWMSGSNTKNQPGVYGTKGVGDITNIPGARDASASWVDSSGSLWLFSGGGLDKNGKQGYLNDLWKFEPSNGKWTWFGGSEVVNQSGMYGTKGIGSMANIPGARQGAICWANSDGSMWLMSGFYQGPNGYAKDLWKYESATNQWTWIEGSNVLNKPGVYGISGIGSTTNQPGARYSSSSWTDSAGNMWLFGGLGYDKNGEYDYLNDLWKYEPIEGKWIWRNGSDTKNQKGAYGTKGEASATSFPGARNYSATWISSDGSLWLFGGVGFDKNGNQTGYLNDLWKYDPLSNTWTWISGSDLINQKGNYGIKGVGSISNNPGGHSRSGTWIDDENNLWLFGGQGQDKNGTTNLLNDLWRFEPADGKWTWMGGNDITRQPGVYGTKGVGSSGNIPGARLRPAVQIDKLDNVWLFGGMAIDKNGSAEVINDLWKYETIAGNWTWMGGNDFVLQTGIYGTKEIGSVANIPGARDGSVSWVDSRNNLWLFGGQGPDFNYLNDLWKYEISTGKWAWMKGSQVSNQPGIYGTKDFVDDANMPGSRFASNYWMQKGVDRLWLFGGIGDDKNGARGILNDLWQISTKDSQTITFTTLPTMTYGDIPFTLSASSTSGLGITYSGSEPNVANIENNVVTIKGVGASFITAIQEGNDVFEPAQSIQNTLVVNKAIITAIAENKIKVYGDLNPQFSISYNGFVNSENGDIINTKPMATSSASVLSVVGSYPITPSGGVDDNYEFIYIDGALSVNKAMVTATVENKTRPFGQENPAFSIIYDGLRNNDFIEDFDTEPTASTTATKTSLPGAYPIVVSGGLDLNYDFTYVNGTLTIENVVTGMNENFEEVLKVFPNPTSNFIQIKLSSKQAEQVNSIQIISREGKILNNIIVPDSNQINHDVSSYATGIYFILIKTKKSFDVLKFVKN